MTRTANSGPSIFFIKRHCGVIMSLEGHRLIGTWRSLEETLSVVEYSVDVSDEIFGVSAADSYDGELGEVNDVHWDQEKMSYHSPVIGPPVAATRNAECDFIQMIKSTLPTPILITNSSLGKLSDDDPSWGGQPPAA